MTQRKRLPATAGVNTAAQCSAHTKSTGKRCRRPAILGGTVCPMHGGSAPQVKAAAKERLDGMVSPALTQLNRLLLDPAVDPIVTLRAVREVLDRAGIKDGTPTEVRVTMSPDIAARIAAMEERARQSTTDETGQDT